MSDEPESPSEWVKLHDTWYVYDREEIKPSRELVELNKYMISLEGQDEECCG